MFDFIGAPKLQRPLIGHPKNIRPVIEKIQTIRQAGAAKLPFLILGETGVGKGNIAHAIHELGPRCAGPFITVNCSALPKELVESEFFGHERGAFTGAVVEKVGKFELADGGTIFLDEIGDMPLDVQTTLLHVMEEQSMQRVGGTKNIPIDVHIILATHRNLEQLQRRGGFRQDLYYRINGLEIKVPALRQRHDDIPLLVDYYVQAAAERMRIPIPRVTAAAQQALLEYAWPGNIRELSNTIDRVFLVLNSGEAIDVAHLQLGTAGEEDEAMIAYRDQRELDIRYALKTAVGNQAAAARMLNISAQRLHYWVRKFGIDAGAYR